METRRIEEHTYPAAEATELQDKVAGLIDDENLATFTVTKHEDGTFELILQLKYPATLEGRKA